MKLVITADVHLKAHKDTPERYSALEYIFKQAQLEKITTVLICGDLFDNDFHNYSDFEKMASYFSQLNLWILPGNHDSGLSSKNLAVDNVRVFDQPELIGDDLKFLMIPYLAGKTMGEVIAEYTNDLEANQWVLCGHGDWLEGRRSPNPYEPGIYMPLTRRDLVQYQPAQVFLGHIHACRDEPIHYPGSPCGLDISETSQRRFLLFDTTLNQVESCQVDNLLTYQSHTITILPVEDEAGYVHKLAEELKESWKIDQPDLKKTSIRLKVQGVTQDKTKLLKSLQKEFDGYQFYKNEEFETTELSVAVDPNRIRIAESVRERLEDLDLNTAPDEPGHDRILLESLKLIFEV